MSLTLLSSPDKIVNGITSNVNAAITDLPYAFKREDTTVFSFFITGSNTLGVTQNNGDTSTMNIGDTVYVEDTTDQSFTPGIVKVTAINDAQTFQTDLPYANDFPSTGVVGYVNLLTERSDYNVQLDILDTSLVPIFTNPFFYKPRQNGLLELSIDRILTTLIESLATNSLSYVVNYREFYNGVAQSYVPTTEVQAILGERSIGLKGGSNLWERVLNITPSFTVSGFQQSGAGGRAEFFFIGDVTSQLIVDALCTIDGIPEYNGTYNIFAFSFSSPNTSVTLETPFISNTGIAGTAEQNILPDLLTFFDAPGIWDGWYTAVSVLVDPKNAAIRLGSNIADFVLRDRDINNGSLVQSTKTQFFVDSGAGIREFPLVITGPIQPVFVLANVTAPADTSNPYSKTLKCEVKQECDNPIMVTWVNSLGASEYYLFDIKQEVRLGETGELIYEPAFSGDVENKHRQKVKINSDETLGILCTAEKLTQADVRALHEMKTSENVEVFLTKDGSERIGVIIESSSETVYTTDEPLNSFNVILSFPTDYKFFDVKHQY